MANYTVKKGDGWYRISKNTGIPVLELLKMNNATLDTVIHPGLTLTLLKADPNIDKWELNNFAKDWANSRMKEIQTMVSNATLEAEKSKNVAKYDYYKGDPAKTYSTMRNTDNNVAILERLIELGYNPGKVDGIIGKNTIAALKEAAKSGHILHNGKLISPNAESYLASNSPYALAHRALIDNIYPYDYNPKLSFDKNNITAYNEFLNLDLNTEEGKKRAAEIRLMKQEDGKPIFSNRSIRDNNKLLKSFRERYDLLLLNAGKPQKYNSFRQYTDDKGDIFYLFSDPSTNEAYINASQASRLKYGSKNGRVIATKEGVVDKNGKPVEYIPIDHTNALFNQYTIYDKQDDYGNAYTEAYDKWDLAPTEFLPGSEIVPKIRIRSYNNIYKPTSTQTEEFTIPNSNYSGRAEYLSSEKKPRATSFDSPASFNYIIKNVRKLF